MYIRFLGARVGCGSSLLEREGRVVHREEAALLQSVHLNGLVRGNSGDWGGGKGRGEFATPIIPKMVAVRHRLSRSPPA